MFEIVFPPSDYCRYMRAALQLVMCSQQAIFVATYELHAASHVVTPSDYCRYMQAVLQLVMRLHLATTVATFNLCYS